MGFLEQARPIAGIQLEGLPWGLAGETALLLPVQGQPARGQSCGLQKHGLLALQGLFVLSTTRDGAAPVTCSVHSVALLSPAVLWAHPARHGREHPRLERAPGGAGVLQALRVMRWEQLVPEASAGLRAVHDLPVLGGAQGPAAAVGVLTDGHR